MNRREKLKIAFGVIAWILIVLLFVWLLPLTDVGL